MNEQLNSNSLCPSSAQGDDNHVNNKNKITNGGDQSANKNCSATAQQQPQVMYNRWPCQSCRYTKHTVPLRFPISQCNTPFILFPHTCQPHDVPSLPSLFPNRKAHGKCDRLLSGCSTCSKRGRVCLYDRHEPTAKPPHVINNRVVKNKTKRRTREEIERARQQKTDTIAPQSTSSEQTGTSAHSSAQHNTCRMAAMNLPGLCAYESERLEDDYAKCAEMFLLEAPQQRTESQNLDLESLHPFALWLSQQDQLASRKGQHIVPRPIPINQQPSPLQSPQQTEYTSPIVINAGLIDFLQNFYTEYAVLASIYVNVDLFGKWLRALLIHETMVNRKLPEPQSGIYQLDMHYRGELVENPISALEQVPLAAEDMILLYMDLALILQGAGETQLAEWYYDLGEKMIDHFWFVKAAKNVQASNECVTPNDACSDSRSSTVSSSSNGSDTLTYSDYASSVSSSSHLISEQQRKEFQQCAFALMLASFYLLANDEFSMAKLKVHQALHFLRFIGAVIDNPTVLIGFDLFHRHIFINGVYTANNPQQQITSYQNLLRRGFGSSLVSKLPVPLESVDPLSDIPQSHQYHPPQPSHEERPYLGVAAMQISQSDQTFINKENLQSSLQAHKLAYDLKFEDLRVTEVYRTKTSKINAVILLKGFELRGKHQ